MNANPQNPNPRQQNANQQQNPNQPAPRARAPMTTLDLYLFDPAHHLVGAWLATLWAQQYDDNEAQVNIPARLGGDAHHWFSTYVWVDLPTFERDFLNRFDYVHQEQALYMIKDRVQKPFESIAEYRNRFYRMFMKTERGEQVGRDLFIDGLRSRTIRAKLRKQFSPINHTLQQIMADAEEMEGKFATSFLEGEDYPKEGDSSELSRARVELAALQNKFENMGFVSGPVTYMEQIPPKRPAPSVITGMPAPVIPTPVMTAPPPPIENPVRSSESTAIFELTKTLISMIQEIKKEQREHNARLEAMMRNMRPITVRAAPIQQGLAPTHVLGGSASNLNVCYVCHQPWHLARDWPHRPPQKRVGVAPMAAAPIANGSGRVGALMEEMEGRGSALATAEEAAELIPLDQCVSLGYPGLGMIGTIRPTPEQKEVAEWRPSPGEMESGGPTFVSGEFQIDVLNIIRALDHRIPLPIGHLLSISEQANERMLQHFKANRKRFALARTPSIKAKSPTPDENTAGTSDPIRVGLIQKDDHFLRIKPIPWKSAECDFEIWGVPYNAIIDSRATVLAISLRVRERAGRRNDLIMLTERDQLVSKDEENIKTVGRMTNVAFRLGKVHALGDVVVLDVNAYDVLFGLPGLVALRANLDFERQSIILRNTGGKPYAVPMRLTLRTTINAVPRVSSMTAGTLRMITWENSADDELPKFDIRHGFHHILVKEEDRSKTTFVLFEGTWQWVRCPMGICNAPATFQRAMNVTFQNFVNKTQLTQGMINFCVALYMDDILVYSETYHGHAQHIEWILGALRNEGFKIALEQSDFFLSEISFLGYVVTRGGLQPDSRKVAVVKEAPVPTWLTQVRAFLGLTSYYRRFIKGFAAIVRPLTNLLRKHQPLQWDSECGQTFDALKEALVTAPVLIRPDPTKQFILITDWQPEAISAILAQKGNDGREHVIEYARGRRWLIACLLVSFSFSFCYSAQLTIAMSFLAERAFGDPLLVPRCYISAIRQVYHPRLSPNLRRLAQFFCTEGVYAAAEFQFAGSPRAVVLAEAVAVHRRSAPGISHVSTVVAFSGNINTVSPLRHTAIRPTLWLWAQQLASEWNRWLTPHGDNLFPTGIDLDWIRAFQHEPAVVLPELIPSNILNEPLADDLPLEIVSQSDNSPVPHVLTRTLTPYLQWSACLEEPGSGRNPPSQRDYLSPYEIVDLAFFQDRTASENEEVEIAEEEERSEKEEAEEEDAEEETPEEGSYSEHSEGEQSPEDDEGEEEDQEELDESEWEGFEEEVRAEARAQAQAQKREDIAAGKRQLDFASAANQQLTNDPARDPESPKPEDGDPTVETSAAPARRRRSRSPSPYTSARPPIRPRTDAGHLASSPVVIPPSP
ncbi:hypothetical protein CBR_g55030 [Chara braunii]|uniref:Reverse transcriptase domain-containing protein n=1 Tax=Chara braunii TaxID=69332 RepID=A0A388MCH2_CHABU|nr:hypothetical protein CBR_g55030 [Chara braunii]|eukprot:GBG92261.1 hypothetical protein CBR_g55030 [Chara braunii]